MANSVYRKRHRANLLLRLVVVLILANIIYACANVGNPEGGPYDMQPPKLVKATPNVRSLEVTKRKIKLEFDEYVKLNKQERIIISPAQITPPKINAVGKTIVISLEDTLRPETTYNLYFDDVIVDNNEDNALEDFSYTFSTGKHIDTMQMSGWVLDARTLEPIKDVVVGAYYAGDTLRLLDSIALKTVITFASRTNEQGKFSIRGLRDSSYFAIALKDNDNNYLFDGLSESFAYHPYLLKTSKLDSIRTDTIRIDSIVRRDTLYRDSIVSYPYTYFYPEDVTLLLYTPTNKRKGLERSQRLDSLVLNLSFYHTPKEIPQLKSLDKPSASEAELYYATQANQIISYWLKDKELIGRDSIRFELSYEATDSLMQVQERTDTLTFYKPKAKPAPKVADTTAVATPKFKLTFADASAFNKGTVRDSLIVSTTRPVEVDELSKLKLEEMLDSVSMVIPYKLVGYPHAPLSYLFDFERKAGASYRVQVDSASLFSIYGEEVEATKIEQKALPSSELGELELKIVELDTSAPMVAELLNKQGEAVFSASLTRQINLDTITEHTAEVDSIVLKAIGETPPTTTAGYRLFSVSDIPPGEYFVRLFIDFNEDGAWTTGSYPTRVPEPVYYSPSVYSIKKSFVTRESWSPLALPLAQQRPEALRKERTSETQKKKVDKNEEYYRKHPRKTKNSKKNAPKP